MTRLVLSLGAAIVVAFHSAGAQAVTPRTLEARNVPPADTTVALSVDGRELLAELRVPTGPGPHPVAIVVHGGCWVTRYADNRYMKPLAEALRKAGVASFNISYRRADEPGGAWPGAFNDVAAQAAMLTPLASRYKLDLQRVIATGHSAGAHFALWLAARPKLSTESAIRSNAVVPPIRAVVPIDGPGDLVGFNPMAARICGNTQVLEMLLASTPDAHPDRWRDASPSSFLPLGVPQAMVRGSLDAGVARPTAAPKGSMLDYAVRARAAGDSVWVVAADTTSHFSMLDPEHPAFAVVLKALRDAIAAIRPR